MNCQNCGAKIGAADVFCPNCGAKNEAAAPNYQQNPSGVSPENAAAGAGFQAVPTMDGTKKPFLGMSKTHLLLAIGCVAVTLVLVIVLVCAVFGRSTPKDAVKDFYEAVEDCDADDLLETVPKTYIKTVLDENDLSKKELEKNVQSYLDRYYDGYDDIKISFEGQKKMDQEDFADYIDSDDMEDITVKKAVKYDLKVRYQSDDGDTVETESEEFVVFRYKGDWYSMDAMFLVAMAVYF